MDGQNRGNAGSHGADGADNGSGRTLRPAPCYRTGVDKLTAIDLLEQRLTLLADINAQFQAANSALVLKRQEVEATLERMGQEFNAERQRRIRAEHDIDAYRGALGYPVPGHHNGKLSDGTTPFCGICAARTGREFIDAICDGPPVEPVHARTHELKSHPQFYEPMVAGRKTFEIRLNDRGFEVGDTLLLREWDYTYTGRQQAVQVTYMTDHQQKPGFVVLGIRKL